jgi:hypothetical protein
MPPKKKQAPVSTSGHDVEITEYKSAMMNRTLYEAYCSCGWWPARFFTKAQAENEAKAHVEREA